MLLDETAKSCSVGVETTLSRDIMNAIHVVLATFLWLLPFDLCAQSSPPINYCAQNYIYEVQGDCNFSASYWNDDELRDLLIGEVFEMEGEIETWRGRFVFLEHCFVKIPDSEENIDIDEASCRLIPKPYDTFGTYINA